MASTSKTMPSMNKKTGSSSYVSRVSRRVGRSRGATPKKQNATNGFSIEQDDHRIVINFYGDSSNKTREDILEYLSKKSENKTEKATDSPTQNSAEKPTKKPNEELSERLFLGAQIAFIVFGIALWVEGWQFLTPHSWRFLEGNLLTALHVVFFSSISLCFFCTLLSEKLSKNK